LSEEQLEQSNIVCQDYLASSKCVISKINPNINKLIHLLAYLKN